MTFLSYSFYVELYIVNVFDIDKFTFSTLSWSRVDNDDFRFFNCPFYADFRH